LKRNVLSETSNIACDQALRGPLAAGRVKEEELPTTSLEFEYLHRKRRCEILIGEDDISNDVITLGTCFSMFVNIRPFFRFLLIENLIAQSTRGATGGWNSYSRDVVAILPFPALLSECPEELACRLLEIGRFRLPQASVLKRGYVQSY